MTLPAPHIRSTHDLPDDIAEMLGVTRPKLSAEEVRDLFNAHRLETRFLPASEGASRRWLGECGCGVTLVPCRSLTEINDLHDNHLTAVKYDARRAKLRAKVETGTARLLSAVADLAPEDGGA